MTDPYGYLLRRVGYPALDLLRSRRVASTVRELERSQYWDYEKLLELQVIRLRRLLQYAGDTVPYYKNLFRDIGFDSRSVTQLDDLRSVPPLTKAAIRRHQKDLVSSAYDIRRLTPGRTGGSTGVPTRFYHDKKSLDAHRAAMIRSMAWAQLQVGERHIKVSGSHFDYDRSKKLKVRLAQFLLRQQSLPAIDLRDDHAHAYARLIRRFRPVAIWGYASAIYVLALMFERYGIDLTVRSVILSSDTVTAAERAKIEEVFRCRTFDSYGSREFAIASECGERSGLHINAENLIVEVDAVTSGREDARLLITDLSNFAFPFIRYEIGDVGALGPGACPCGRGLPRLSHITGRLSEFIVTPSGRHVAAPAFTVLFSDVNTIDSYQIRQEEAGRVDVLVVRGTRYSAGDEAYLRSGLGEMLGPDVVIAFRYVAKVDRGVSGKRQLVSSSVASMRDSPAGMDR